MPATPASVTLDSVFERSSDVLCQEVGGEAVLLDLASEQYFGLNPVGTRIWQLVGDGTALQSIRDTLVAEYDAPAEQIETDLLMIAKQLSEAGLLKAV